MRMTEAEIIEELQEALADGGATDAFTTPELAQMLNIGHAAVRRRLKVLQSAGRLEPVRVMRMSLTGTMRRCWGYRIIHASGSDTEDPKAWIPS